MKHIYLNLKRFDIPVEYGGVNRIAPIQNWGSHVVIKTQEELKKYNSPQTEFIHFLPEAHLLNAIAARTQDSPVLIGSQSVYFKNTQVGGNFGAYTGQRPANAVKALGCEATIVGHCEEREEKIALLNEAGVKDKAPINRILNKEIKNAVEAGLKVVYCIGESQEEVPRWQSVLKEQLDVGLEGVDKSRVVIAYEPIWSIGPGKKPADKNYITKIARFVKENTNDMDVIYGGGLKKDNAEMLASIPEIDGGMFALTRFQGEIGFYPEEFLETVKLYLGK
jgi:triosephosphate isomerase